MLMNGEEAMDKDKNSNEHPEVKDIHNICDITSDKDKTGGVCEEVNKDSATKDADEKKKKDKELDQALKETFPASDPTAEY